MRTTIRPKNPHGYNRCGFAWENVPENGKAHIDCGCHDGAFLSSLCGKGIGYLAGVDVSREAVSKGQREYPDLDIRRIEAGRPLPFDDGIFTSITALDVIEHVYDQKQLLDELHRVSAPHCQLIVTVPGKYIFSFLDTGNWKFRLPALHRRWYTLRHSAAEYERRYISNPDGLVGDVSAEKRWHEHFSREKLAALLDRSGFAVTEFDGAAFWGRPIALLRAVCGWCRPIKGILRRLSVWDARRFASMHLFCAAARSD